MATSTYIGVGAAAHGDNATVVPALPAGIVAGDLLVLFTSIRNTAAFAGAITNPSGWDILANVGGHVLVLGKYWDGVFGAPSCAFAGGVAGDTTSAQIAAFRGASTFVDVVASLTNGSAQNIAYPALAPVRAGGTVIVGGWKQDDWTSVATLAGMTEIAEPSTLTGNDQGQVWDYVIQTTAAAIGSGSFVVTGGAAAVSKGFALSIRPKPTLTVTTQAVYPPRALIAVTDLALGDVVALYRVVSGLRTAVRGGSSASVTDPSFVVTDAELPYGVPVSYVASVNGVEYASSGVTYTLTGGKVALTDAVTGTSAEVVIMAYPSRTFERENSVFALTDRKVAVVGNLTGFTGTLELYAETTSIRDNIYNLLATATQGIVQIRQPGGYDGIDAYLAVLSADENRFSQDGSDQRRLISLDVVQVSAWAATLSAGGYTLQNLADAYNGLTLTNLNGDYATLLAIALASF
jgi:hypothetical protein